MKEWYSAHLLFEAEVDGALPIDALCEERTVVVVAADRQDAELRARMIGLQEQHSYRNQEMQVVNWKFKDVLEIQELGVSEIVDGQEVFSRLFRKGMARL